MKAIHRCVYMKTNVDYGRNRYFYVLIWNLFMSFHSFRCAPLVNRHTISITRGRSTGLPYQHMKEPISLFCIGYNASNLFRNLQRRLLACRDRDTILQIRFPLWSTVRLKVKIIWQPPSRGLPLSATREHTEQLCVFEPRKLAPLSSFLL